MYSFSYYSTSKFNIRLVSESANDQISQIQTSLKEYKDSLKKTFEEKKSKITSGDDLVPGVLKIVKVYLAIKRK